MSRYTRQIRLPEMGNKGQSKLISAHVLVVGIGGLATPVLQYLVGAGIGQLTLVDADRVSCSNIHRQTLFREIDIDAFKVDAATHTLNTLNSECDICPMREALTPANAYGLVSNADIVLDCADSFAVSYTLSDICLETKIPLISASVLGFMGYVGGFCDTAPSLRAVFPDLPERAASCATAGVMGPVVGIIGSAQAQMSLNHILSLKPSPLGQMMTFDLRSFKSSSFRFDQAPEPETTFGFISQSDITDSDHVFELRDLAEAPIAVAPHATRMSVAEFKMQTPVFDTNARAIFTCRSGLRAWQAAKHLHRYWSGNISLIAMGAEPEIERHNS